MTELVAVLLVIVALGILVVALSRRARRATPPPPEPVPARTGTDVALRRDTTLAVGADRTRPAPGAPPRPNPETPSSAGPRTASPPPGTASSEPSPARLLGPGAPPRPDPVHRPPARLFAMGELVAASNGYRHHGPYAVVAMATTGLTPLRDRIIEIAVVTTDARGRITDEFTTLVDPAGAGVGPTFLHGIEAADLAFTPDWDEVAREVIARFEGHVVVAHNAGLVEQFLGAGFLASGLLAPSVPALDLVRLGQRTFPTRNQRLATLVDHLRLPGRPGESALGDARLTAGVLARVLAAHGDRLAYPIPPPPVLDRVDRGFEAAPRQRAHGFGTPDTWVAGLLARVSMSATEANDVRVAAYLEGLTSLLTRGHIVADEARDLTRLLAASGYPAAQIRDILERLLESLRQAAFEEPRLSKTQLSHLRAAATSVGIPTYFDDLIPPPPPPAPEPGSGSFARPVRKPVPPPPPAWTPRCGHCLSTGHYTSSCPRLAGRRGGGPVSPVRPIDPI